MTFEYRPRPHTRCIIIHESHTGPEVPSAVAHLRAKGRANGLLDIGYHAVVERNGVCTITRPWPTMGSHCAGRNHDSIGVCLSAVGPADWIDKEDEAQALRGRLVTLMAIHNSLIPIYGNLPVYGHDEVQRRKDKTHPCPSIDMDWLRNYLGASNACAHA